MMLTKDKINLMSNDELHYETAKILGDIPYSRSYEGFMEHYAQELYYTGDWCLVGEIVGKYVHKLFRNIGGTWTVVMRDTIDDGTMSGQPIFTSGTDANPLRAMAKCLILHHQEIDL